MLLFGGGFSLAAAISTTGAGSWVGCLLADLADWPLLWLIFAIAAVVALLSTVATNTAVSAVFMPILGTMAVATSFDPRFLMILGCLAAQCAYALPVATTGNAICFGSGYIDMIDMVKVEMTTDFEAMEPNLLVKAGNEFQKDPTASQSCRCAANRRIPLQRVPRFGSGCPGLWR